MSEIFNIERGSRFAAEEFTKVLQSKGIRTSMDGEGRWRDNVLVGRLWSSVSTKRVAHRAGRGGLRGAALGTVENRSRSSVFVAYEILSNQPEPPLWS
jgi:hypothetical protein